MSQVMHMEQTAGSQHDAAAAATRGDHAGHGAARPARLRLDTLSESEGSYTVLMHLSPLLVFVFPALIFTPLVLWLVRRHESAFIDDHGREVVNFGLSLLIYSAVLFWTIAGPIAFAVLGIVSVIRAAVAAYNGEYFRYPITIRFLQ